MKRSSITIAAVCFFTAGLSISFFTLPLWVAIATNAAKDGSRSDWLGFAGGIIGNLITAAVAGAAAYYAWLGIKRQLRINVISREEERIEARMPALYKAREELMRIASKQDPQELLIALEPFRDRHNLLRQDQQERWGVTDESVAMVMPYTDPVSRRYLMGIILRVRATAARVLEDKNNMDAVHAYKSSQKVLNDYLDRLHDIIMLQEKRLIFFRNELERYFEQ
jgi:hypothetical protein